MITVVNAKCCGNTIRSGTPLGENIYFENGVFNPLYTPSGFDPENINQEINYNGYYAPGDLGYYSTKDYDMHDFTYQEGSLDDGSVINFNIHDGTDFIQSGFVLSDNVMRFSNSRLKSSRDSRTSCFTGGILPIKNFYSFFGINGYINRAIYIKYKKITPNTSMDVIRCEIGYKNTSSTISSINYGYKTTYYYDEQWNDGEVFTYYPPAYDRYHEDYDYFLRIGLDSAMNSYQGRKDTIVEICKIWADNL